MKIIDIFRIRFFLFSFFIFLFSFASAFAERELSVKVSPIIEITPLDQFDIGFGGSAVVDWSFLSFSKFNVGVSAGVGFINMPVQAREALTFLDILAGPFLRYRPLDRLAVQAGFNAGIYQFSFDEESYTKMFYYPSAGIEFYISPYFSLFADARYKYRVFSETVPLSSFGASVGIRMNISEFLGNKTRVNVEKSSQYRIFPVSWAWYEDNPIATVKILNEEPVAIRNVNLSIFMESYMGEPFNFATIPRIPAGAEVEVPVNALFNDVMLGLTEIINANGLVQVEYSSLGSRKETEIPIQMPIYHRNAMTWEDDRRAAAFVSAKDSAARIFARYVASAVNLHLEDGTAAQQLYSTPQNVLYAAALFEALRLYGMSYIVVPTMAFADLRADSSVLDHLTYPYECLYYRGGDCGHLSILFCSLLESLDIETAFITVPGHIYIAFDIGDYDWRRGDDLIIEIESEKDGVVTRKRWLPVEITVPDEGFMRAWRIGMRQWVNHGEDADIFPVRECWEVYPSVTVSASVDYPPEMPEIEDIIKALEAELAPRR